MECPTENSQAASHPSMPTPHCQVLGTFLSTRHTRLPHHTSIALDLSRCCQHPLSPQKKKQREARLRHPGRHCQGCRFTASGRQWHTPHAHRCLIRSAAFSASIMTGALVLPEVTEGMTEASTTRRLPTPRTLQVKEELSANELPLSYITSCGHHYTTTIIITLFHHQYNTNLSPHLRSTTFTTSQHTD